MTTAAEPKDPPDLGRGPHGWANWQAQRSGRPARKTARVGSSSQVLPTWSEYALYSDAYLAGRLKLGPYGFLITIPGAREEVGRLSMQLVLRAYDHLPDPDHSAAEWETDVSDYHGGDLGDELASLLSLLLACRLRSGGVVRRRYAGSDPLGSPSETEHSQPVLAPPHGRPVLPRVAAGRDLADAEGPLRSYPELRADDAVALVRAAGQYADALWLADADPRVSWIKLVGALETAANQWDAAPAETPLDRLRRYRPKVHEALGECPQSVRETIAKDLAHTFKAEHKFTQFVLRFAPGPPAERPDLGRFDWAGLEQALRVIYDWRSRDLHDGIPFPPSLCSPPQGGGNGQPMERFPASAVASAGGVWEEDRLPMYLHLFAYVAGGALKNWWASLAAASTESGAPGTS